MPTFNVQKIADLIKELPNVDSTKIGMFGGDFDTNEILVQPCNDGPLLHISAYRFEDCLSESEIDELEDPQGVTITDGLSSRGGLNTPHIQTGYAFAEIKNLLMGLGFRVFNHYEEFY